MSEKINISPEKNESEFTAQSELVRYKDGNSALIFNNPGETVAWQGNKYINSPEMRTANTMIIKTESGNEYAIGQGLVINAREQMATNIPRDEKDIPNITIGDSWSIPGVMKTSPVESVSARYKNIPEGSADRQANEDSPFEQLNQELVDIRHELLSEKGLR